MTEATFHPAELLTKRFVKCLACGERDFSVEHLYGLAAGAARTFGPWYCDGCGAAHEFEVSAQGELGVRICEGMRMKRTAVVLRMDPPPGPIFFVVAGRHFEDAEPEVKALGDKDRYFYEQHTCTTNWLRDTFLARIDGDSDPHGLAEYVTTIDLDPRSEENKEELQRRLAALGEQHFAAHCTGVPPCDDLYCTKDAVTIDWIDGTDPSPRCEEHRVKSSESASGGPPRP